MLPFDQIRKILSTKPTEPNPSVEMCGSDIRRADMIIYPSHSTLLSACLISACLYEAATAQPSRISDVTIRSYYHRCMTGVSTHKIATLIRWMTNSKTLTVIASITALIFLSWSQECGDRHGANIYVMCHEIGRCSDWMNWVLVDLTRSPVAPL